MSDITIKLDKLKPDGADPKQVRRALQNIKAMMAGSVQPKDDDLTAIAALTGTGVLCRATNTPEAWYVRELQAPAAGFTITNPKGIAGDPTFVLANDLAAYEGLSSTGLVVRTGDGTATVRSIAQPAAGITVTNANGVDGNPTLALANDLAAWEGLSTTGFAVRTGDGTATTRTITVVGGADITNGDGISANPEIEVHSSWYEVLAVMGLL